MFNIKSNGIITMSRCDTWCNSFFINLGSKMYPIPYDLKDGEFLYFAVLEPNMKFDNALICKKLSVNDKTPCESGDIRDFNHDGYLDGYVDVYFKVEDTEQLLPGLYYYEVKLWRPVTDEKLIKKGIKEKIDTVIPRTKFIIND